MVYPGGDPRKLKELAVISKNLLHPNIVSLLGVTDEPPEFIPTWTLSGDLPGYIARHPDLERLPLLSDVAEGLNYLHSCDVIHGDLNGSKILVDATGRARITDFGLATVTQDPGSASAGHRQNQRWIAPEILGNQGTYNKEADIFSFAGVTIEAFTGTVPFSDKSPRTALLAIMSGERPPRSTHPSLTDGLWALTQQCWNQEAHLRPRALRVSCILGTPAWKRLIDRPLASNERTSLITYIFSSRDETELVGSLCGDDAQSFVDVVDQLLENLEPRLRKKSLGVLCKICGRQALLPRTLQIPRCYDRSYDPLYSGGFADVWMGEHQGHGVAVKVLRVFLTSDLGKITRRFCKEVMTWKSLRHPNVLPLLGVTMSDKHFAMISEWMANGNVNEFIKNNRDADRFELLKGVSNGLIYMHAQEMVHGDLKGANVMVDQDGHACLADFGLLAFVSDPTNPATSSSATNAGTTRWMSPELLYPEEFGFEDSRPTRQSDCYALGMVILEVLSGEPPFARNKDFIVMRKVINGERPERPEGERAWFTDDLWRTLEQCWLPQPNDRPTVEAVLECLERASKVWQPPPPVAEDVRRGDDEADFTCNSPGPEKQVEISTLYNPASHHSSGTTLTTPPSSNPPLPNLRQPPDVRSSGLSPAPKSARFGRHNKNHSSPSGVGGTRPPKSTLPGLNGDKQRRPKNPSPRLPRPVLTEDALGRLARSLGTTPGSPPQSTQPVLTGDALSRVTRSLGSTPGSLPQSTRPMLTRDALGRLARSLGSTPGSPKKDAPVPPPAS